MHESEWNIPVEKWCLNKPMTMMIILIAIIIIKLKKNSITASAMTQISNWVYILLLYLSSNMGKQMNASCSSNL